MVVQQDFEKDRWKRLWFKKYARLNGGEGLIRNALRPLYIDRHC